MMFVIMPSIAMLVVTTTSVIMLCPVLYIYIYYDHRMMIVMNDAFTINVS